MSAVSRSFCDDALLARLQMIGESLAKKLISQSAANKFNTNARSAHREQLAALPQSTQAATAASHNTAEGDFYAAADDGTAEDVDVDVDDDVHVDEHADEERQESSRHRKVPGMMARKEWPAGAASAINDKAATFPDFAAGKKAVAAAFKAGTLYEGVSASDFSERSRKHPGGAGDPQRGYCDWEVVTENGGTYGCRFVKLTPMPMFTPRPHPTLTLATRLRNLHLHRRLLCTAPVQNFGESSPHLSRDGKWDLNGPCVLIYPVSTCETCLIPA
jgi:hypothetical protein